MSESSEIIRGTERKCAIDGCNALGSPQRKKSGKLFRRKYCPKHYKQMQEARNGKKQGVCKYPGCTASSRAGHGVPMKYCRRHYHESRGRSYSKLVRTRRKYGIGATAYEELVQQSEGRCRICHRGFSEAIFATIDHNHDTGRVRALVCEKCNNRIAGVESAIKYGLLDEILEYLSEDMIQTATAGAGTGNSMR